MWRSLFLHEFPDGNPQVFKGIDGFADQASLIINPNALAPGQRFQFQFSEPLTEIIGVSARMSIRKPNANPDSLRVFGAENEIELIIKSLPGPHEGLSQKAHALLKIGQTPFVNLGTLSFPHRSFVEVRIDWHTSGQARLFQDENLIGYHNAVSPGSELTFGGISVGQTNKPLGAVGPRIGVKRIFVRALKKTDPLGIISRMLPDPPKIENEDPRLKHCQNIAITELLEVVDLLRPFMIQFHNQESQPWSASDVPQSSPFTEASISAHSAALETGLAFKKILSRNDFSSAEAFLDPFERFLTILRDVFPVEFESLTQTILARPGIPADCRNRLQADRATNGAEFEQIVQLIDAAAQRVISVAGEQ